jgi:CheY-like chemotaxis protein
MPRLLLVEDHPLSAEALRRLLEGKTGCRVTVAFDGIQALSMAQADPPDLVLLDLGLPGMDGLELARRLRALPPTQGLPLVALTASVDPKDHQDALAAGCTAVLTKPPELEVLIPKVRQLLGLK